MNNVNDTMSALNNFKKIVENKINEQKTNWFGFFNASAVIPSQTIGVSFINNVMSYIRMSFFSSALSGDKTVYESESAHYIDGGAENTSNVLENFITALLKMQGKLIYKNNESDYLFQDMLISFDTSVINIFQKQTDRVVYNILSYDDNFASKIDVLFKECNVKMVPITTK